MRFNYQSEFEDWCILNNYEPDEFLDQTTLLEKSYSKIIQFYVANDNGTYAEICAYHSGDQGVYDICVEKEGLKRTEEIVKVVKRVYA